MDLSDLAKLGMKIAVKYSDEEKASLDQKLRSLFGEDNANFRKYLDEQGYMVFIADYTVFNEHFNNFVNQVPELVPYIHDFNLFDDLLASMKDLLPRVKQEELDAFDGKVS